MQTANPQNLPFETMLVLRPEPPPRRFEEEAAQPVVSASRLRRLALLVF